MNTTIRVLCASAHALPEVTSASVQLIVTSPPYPMVQMWDEVFALQEPAVGGYLRTGDGRNAFAAMHAVLDRAWSECDRVLEPGGLVCVNIGDATRTLGDGFRLYSNHARVLSAFLNRGYVALPDILWRKPTNSPTKFMGSGMLPPGAYVTYEHEYILVLRKGPRRHFESAPERARRQRSAYFWEERNVWFSDVWSDLRGAPQALPGDDPARQRSGAFPFELAYRLICMFSLQQDLVLDPFAGTGTTLAAALATGRHAVGCELAPDLADAIWGLLAEAPQQARQHARQRLLGHLQFAAERASQGRPLQHTNRPYRFPVMTAQEVDLLIPDVVRATRTGAEALVVEYTDDPQPDVLHAVAEWEGGCQVPGQVEAVGAGSGAGDAASPAVPGAPSSPRPADQGGRAAAPLALQLDLFAAASEG